MTDGLPGIEVFVAISLNEKPIFHSIQHPEHADEIHGALLYACQEVLDEFADAFNSPEMQGSLPGRIRMAEAKVVALDGDGEIMWPPSEEDDGLRSD